MSRPESDFPTIEDLHDGLSRLIAGGLGGLAVQVLVVPDSTMQAITRVFAEGNAPDKRPALMVEMDGVNGRIPVIILSADRWSGGGGMPTRVTQ